MIVYSPDEKKFVGNQPEDGSMSMDTNNNVEVVHIQTPVAGKWRIEIIGSNIPQGPQDFTLGYVGHLEAA
jgi:serine protease AprX